MIVSDLLLEAALQAELDNLRTDPRLQADLMGEAPDTVRQEFQRWLSDAKNVIEIRQGFAVEPPRAPLITIQLAGEQETPTGPFNDFVGAGEDPISVERIGMALHYTNKPGYTAEGEIDPSAQRLRVRVYNPPYFNALIPEEGLDLDLTAYATLTDLVAAIVATGRYAARVNPTYALLVPTKLDKQQFRDLEQADIGLALFPTEWTEIRGTWFQGTWKITAYAINAHIVTWLQAFIKWCLLRQRRALEDQGLTAPSLTGGDYEPVPEWIPANVFMRGVVLSAYYFARYTLSSPMTPINVVDVEPTYLSPSLHS